MRRIRVLLVDDHTLFRAGLSKLLDGRDDIEVVGEASDGKEALRQAQSLKPDVVLMDISMPGASGVEATRQIKARLPGVRVLVVTVYGNEEYVRQLLLAGGSGYVLKDIAPDELVRAIHAVHKGEWYLASSVIDTVLREYVHWAAKQPGRRKDQRLTERQHQVLSLVKQGLGNREIAERLFISPRTVENHKQHIARRLGLEGVTGLAEKATPARPSRL